MDLCVTEGAKLNQVSEEEKPRLDITARHVVSDTFFM